MKNDEMFFLYINLNSDKIDQCSAVGLILHLIATDKKLTLSRANTVKILWKGYTEALGQGGVCVECTFKSVTHQYLGRLDSCCADIEYVAKSKM